MGGADVKHRMTFLWAALLLAGLLIGLLLAAKGSFRPPRAEAHAWIQTAPAQMSRGAACQKSPLDFFDRLPDFLKHCKQF